MDTIRVESAWEGDRSDEDTSPEFRVYFHQSTPIETGGWTAVYDITGADMLQVIDWAQRQATGTITWGIALLVQQDREEEPDPDKGRDLVWLVGVDGNDRGPDDVAPQRRMLQRRGTPIQIPASDRMPDEHNIELPFS